MAAPPNPSRLTTACVLGNRLVTISFAPFVRWRKRILMRNSPGSRAAVNKRSRIMKIAKIEAFQIEWEPGEPAERRGAFLLVHADDGTVGIGEASPMLGGLASLTILRHHIAPLVIGADPLD